jgi:hypothetical protein
MQKPVPRVAGTRLLCQTIFDGCDHTTVKKMYLTCMVILQHTAQGTAMNNGTQPIPEESEENYWRGL